MINIPKGTKDVLPELSYRWHYVENTVKEIARRFCMKEIRTPIFEHTELFLRGVGETTDIVNKEMYTFIDKGDRSITLKPEGTAGVARSYIENGLASSAQPIKMYYITPVFRYEKPQSGRLRQHHQFGAEIFGSYSAQADVEVMMIAKSVFDEFGVDKLTLHINNIGCKNCRKVYNDALKAYFAEHLSEMCPTCKERFEKNPLRILDCKEKHCAEINAKAPITLDYICDDCKVHHTEVCDTLDMLKIDYIVNPKVVRGLDYYTGTVFEFISSNIGAQGTVCGGGRYNNLVEEVGGKACPAVGFGMGLERLLLMLDALGLPSGNQNIPDIYIAPICDQARAAAPIIVNNLRKLGVAVETDLSNRSVKAQMKFADKIGARYVGVIGEEEMVNDEVTLKDMSNGNSVKAKIHEINNIIRG